MPTPEAELGLRAYLTTAPGIKGHLREEPEDFRVIETGPDPPHVEGRFTAARIRLRNWETNRFAGRAARELGLKRGKVGFAGMKDKRAVTEQWFTFACPPDRLDALAHLEDVEVLTSYTTSQGSYTGAHGGNRFVLRVRGHHGDHAQVDALVAAIRAEGGVPNYFGPQRFGGSFRPITHHVGKAIVAGDLEEAVRLYLGNPVEGERPEAYAARKVYEETRDPAAALDAYPPALDLEREMLKRLLKRPEAWRNALKALPPNLLKLFVHAHQSWIFNEILSARLAAGLGLQTAHIGDRVMANTDDGTLTHLVTAKNQERVQREIDRGRAAPTAPLVGIKTQLAEGGPGDIEHRVMAEHGIDARDFRCYGLPEVKSPGRRRLVLQGVADLDVQWTEGDPVVSFSLGKGAYATVVMREIMKVPLE